MQILKLFIWFLLLFPSCVAFGEQNRLLTGAERMEEYFPLLEGKKAALVTNQTGRVGEEHLVDLLLGSGIPGFQLIKVFSPEHGFRGNVDAGALVQSGTDSKTGLKIISLYGSHKKPLPGDLSDIDIILFDLQDVGVRFYTYISTLHYVMEACAENDVPLIILDRPNPNGNYIDGPVLEMEFQSFVGMHPVPVVHGMTIGEYARMINGEGWLVNGIQCDLKVIECLGYTHQTLYNPPVSPSPNLPDFQSIRLYPSLCFFEGTVISEGRGTDFPFKVFGHPELLAGDFYFTPESRPGAAVNPKLKGLNCRGFDLRNEEVDNIDQLNMDWLIKAYKNFPDKSSFFTDYLSLLSGTRELQRQIEEGWSSDSIRETWENGIEDFMKIRVKYLIYP
ncbi:MAG: DUF1343 domain-containing protein [Bacteroidales bacterium]|nr:DUF1343 domain-containing protein [Bacteroidales bacterium]